MNLEDLDTRELALADSAPAMGRWVLTGAQQFGLLDGIGQSLAARVGMLTLLPPAHAELPAAVSLEERLSRGGYPALHGAHRELQPAHWFASYLATYVERDVRQILNVGNLLTFQRFVAMCAARSAQWLNLNRLAADCGIGQSTARQWLTVLQASHLVALLAPCHRNFGKRLVKGPQASLPGHGLAVPADCHFWRDNHGLEIDIMFEHANRLHAIECKSGTTYSADWLAPVRRWRQAAGPQAADPILAYGGDESYRREDHAVLNWRELGCCDLSAVCLSDWIECGPKVFAKNEHAHLSQVGPDPNPLQGTAWSFLSSPMR